VFLSSRHQQIFKAPNTINGSNQQKRIEFPMELKQSLPFHRFPMQEQLQKQCFVIMYESAFRPPHRDLKPMVDFDNQLSVQAWKADM
jgi:hypothetical protein